MVEQFPANSEQQLASAEVRSGTDGGSIPPWHTTFYFCLNESLIPSPSSAQMVNCCFTAAFSLYLAAVIKKASREKHDKRKLNEMSMVGGWNEQLRCESSE